MPYYGALPTPTFEPAVRDILSITQTNPAIVTTALPGIYMRGVTPPPGPNDYLTGLIVRLIIPDNYGMIQLNDFQGVITVLTASTFSIDVDTRRFDPFVIPVEEVNQPEFNVAQVTPIGEEAAILTQSFVNVLTPQF